MKSDDVLVRGLKQGLMLLLGDGPAFEIILQTVETKLATRANFFRGAQVTVRTGARVLTEQELQRLIQTLESFGMVVAAVEPGYPVAEPPAPRNQPRAEAAAAERTWQTGGVPVRPGAKVVSRTLRSGASIRYDGDVIILGDVNPGAEVVATGHIVVMGALRGLAHAGAKGDETAIVAAIRLQPTQLRIGTVIGRPPDGEFDTSGFHPEVARVENGAIVVESSSL
jgi:septum site-determining protein MinC